MKAPAKVYVFLLAGILSFGVAPVFVRMAGETDPILLAAGRLLFALVFLLPFWIPRAQSPAALRKSGIRPGYPLLAGLCLGLHLALWIASLQLTSVASASVLVTMHPVILIVFERFLFTRKFPAHVWIGVIIALLGSILLGYSDLQFQDLARFPEAALGNTLAAVAALLFAVYFLIGRKIRQRTDWINYVTYVYGAAFVVCLALVPAVSGFKPTWEPRALLVMVLLAVGPTLMGHGSMNYAVKYFSATALATLILVEALLASVFAFVLYAELPPALSLLAMGVILGGVVLTWYNKKVKPPAAKAEHLNGTGQAQMS
jgi:drug/metabolite transporter (DMT)-like permease